MSIEPKISVIVCAAGKGERAGLSKNKLLVPLCGICPIERVLAFFSSFPFECVVAYGQDDEKEILPLCKKYGALPVLGGSTRSESVFHALQKVSGEIVLIHDGARPYLTSEIVERCIESVQKYGSGICAVPVVDTLATASDDENIKGYIARTSARAIQTPQGFFLSEIRSAYERAFEDGKKDFTDDSSVYSSYVRPTHFCLGDPENKKLTYASDFSPAPSACGFGVDTHAFGKEQDHILLAGVKIPAKSGLIAHSDGDVLCHAVMDAMLSGAGLFDIGHYFPDTDEKYKNANSTELLKEVISLVEKAGFRVCNLSVAIQAETPRLAPYIEEIRASLAHLLHLSPTAVGVSAGTNEKLGYVGEGKGITVYAYTLLSRRN